MSETAPTGTRPPITIYTARRVITMDESLPQATAVAVCGDRIVAVGDLASMAPWREAREVTIDERFRDKVLMPGLIDNHVHPFLGALLTPMELIAPEPWRLPDGSVAPAARTPQEYRRLLEARLAARTDTDEHFISFGYQPKLHGRLFRAELDALCPDRPVILWQRSFHETYMNTRAIEKLGLAREQVDAHPQADWDTGHFYETGNKLVVARLMSHFLRPEWYRKGLRITASLMHQGGITTAGDMLFGSMNPDYELAALDEVFEQGGMPTRVVNIFDGRGFGNRAAGKPMGSPDTPVDFAAGLKVIDSMVGASRGRIRYTKAVKLFADGAMFSQLMQMRPPGYIDGHHGEWLMSPEVLADGVRTFWNAGYQIHVHVNGDAGMDAVLDAVTRMQAERPRFDHRFHVHHVGFHAAAQTSRLAALGCHASVNPYYIHALADDYAIFGLGAERASQIARCGSMARAGMKVSFHSDFMMAPTEPLLLAWCAANRITQSGAVASPGECLSLEQALRGITIDAAWALGLEDEVGSIAAGKKADFAVLEDDPFELGVERLKDVRIAGTVFEGTPHLLARPVASLHAQVPLPAAALAPARTHAGDARDAGADRARARYRPVARGGCCGDPQDRCDVLRQWTGWLAEAFDARASSR
jgi:predicted amidohydrolase YtcJ